MTRIEVEGLEVKRRTGFRLGPLSLRVESGSRTALVGPSGSGKTTLLRCLAGLHRPNSGRIALDGRVVDDGRTHVAPNQRGIGFVFQDGALWPHLTAAQHVAFVDPGLSRAEVAARLAEVGLADKSARRPGELSGGEGQRLALARALAGQPKLLLLDEPLRSVDVHLRDALGLLIRRVAEDNGITTVTVTHDREEALSVADELVILGGGRVVESGSAAQLLLAPATAFAASFLCQAVCLPAAPEADGRFATPFGVLPGPTGNGAVSLVLLPGDVVVADGAQSAVIGRVLQVRPASEGALATVELEGQTLHVPCSLDVAPGAEIALALRHAPRFLPSGVEVSG